MSRWELSLLGLGNSAALMIDIDTRDVGQANYMYATTSINARAPLDYSHRSCPSVRGHRELFGGRRHHLSTLILRERGFRVKTRAQGGAQQQPQRGALPRPEPIYPDFPSESSTRSISHWKWAWAVWQSSVTCVSEGIRKVACITMQENATFPNATWDMSYL